VAAATLIIMAGYLYSRPITARGDVDHKTIAGTKNGVQYTIAIFTDTGVIIEDEMFKQDFVSPVINETLANKLDSWYDDVYYLISIRTSVETGAYFTNREDFNKIDIRDSVRFFIPKFKKHSIHRIEILD
jgi:hypothetical protein